MRGRDALGLAGTVGRSGIGRLARVGRLTGAVRLSCTFRGTRIGGLARIGRRHISGLVVGRDFLAVVVLGDRRDIGSTVGIRSRVVGLGGG
jgi:hypothetical protein